MQTCPDTDRQTPPTVCSLNDQTCNNTTIKLTCCTVYSHSAATRQSQVWPCCFCIQAFFKMVVSAAFNISNQCTAVSALESPCETVYVVWIGRWKAWTEVHFLLFFLQFYVCHVLRWYEHVSESETSPYIMQCVSTVARRSKILDERTARNRCLVGIWNIKLRSGGTKRI